MIRKDGSFVRKERLATIAREIARAFQANKILGTIGVNSDSIILWIQVEIGLSRKKAEEYLELIVRARPNWTIEGENIILGGTDYE